MDQYAALLIADKREVEAKKVAAHARELRDMQNQPQTR